MKTKSKPSIEVDTRLVVQLVQTGELKDEVYKASCQVSVRRNGSSTYEQLDMTRYPLQEFLNDQEAVTLVKLCRKIRAGLLDLHSLEDN